MELAASYAAIITLSTKILWKTAEWVNEARHASDVKGDLFSKVSDLRCTLETINSAVQKRQQQVRRVAAFSEEEEKILKVIIQALEGCEQTVEDFSKTIENFSRERETGWFQKAMLQLKLDIKTPTISNFEKRVDANLASLQLLMACLTPFMHEEMQILQRTGERNTEKSFDKIFQEIRRLNELLTQGNFYSPILETQPFHGSAEKATDPVLVGVENEQPDFRTMKETVEVAKSLVNTLSRSGSEVGSGGSGGSVADTRQRGTRSTSPRGIVESGKPQESGFEFSLDYSEVPIRKVSPFTPEMLVALFDGYKRQADIDIASKNYKQAEFNLEKAIEHGEQREAGHAFPFDERFELRKSLASVYTKQNKFSLAAKELSSLKAHAQHDPRRLAGILCSSADIYRAEYHHTRDDRLLERWEHMALAALRTLPEASDENPSDVLKQSADMLVELYRLKGDPVAEHLFRTQYQTSAGNGSGVQASIPGPPNNPTPQGQSLPTPLAPTPPDTPPASSASDAVSGASASQSLLEWVERGEVEAVKVFLGYDKNIDFERTNFDGLTALLLAAKKKNTRIVRLLLGRSDIHARDSNRRTVLHHALRGIGIQDDMIRSLVDYGADVDAVDNYGKSPLHYCVDFNKPVAAQMLIKKGADIEATNPAGETPAMQAANKINMYDIITVLYHAGAHFDRKAIHRLPKKDYAKLLDRLERSKNSSAERRQSGSARSGSVTSHRSSVSELRDRLVLPLGRFTSHQ